jgi:hypothetical protein
VDGFPVQAAIGVDLLPTHPGELPQDDENAPLLFFRESEELFLKFRVIQIETDQSRLIAHRRASPRAAADRFPLAGSALPK